MNTNYQRGFSLLELMVSLAIVSLVSAALFQSMAAWMRLSARASTAADEALTSIAGQQMFDRAVGGLIFAWPEETAYRFIGAPDGFSGVSATPLQGLFPRLGVIQVAIERPDDGRRGRIVYQSGATDWTLQEFDETASFSYLGADGAWRANWPPAVNPEPGPFEDAAFFDTPQLPLAIRASYVDHAVNKVWIADISGDPQIPLRQRDQQ